MQQLYLYVLLLSLLNVHSSLEIDSLAKFDINNIIQFKSNSTTCAMFSRNCKIEVILNKHLNLNSLQVNPYKTKFYKFLKLQLCRSNNTGSDCKLATSTENGSDEINVAYIYIDAIIVGKSQLFLNYNFSSDDESGDEDHQHELDFSSSSSNDHAANGSRLELTTTYYFKHDIIISSPQRLLDKIHLTYVIIFQTIVSVFMGLLLDTKAIIKIIKMPIPVLVGFSAQYLLMPLLAFACVKTFNLPPVDALALFIYGCCPGGSASNNWTILLNGDIDLSAIMTFVSTMGSLVFMPAWLYTLGRVFTRAANITIPFSRLVMNLFTTIGPCLFGLLLSKCFPKLKPIILKISKPLILFVVLSFLFLTLYVKYYVFFLVKWKQWIIAPFIPWLGFLFSMGIAWLAKLPKNQVLTVGIETGIQNVGVAFLIIFYNFPSPESDYAILPLISVTSLTTIPLWFYLLVKIIRKKENIFTCLKKSKQAEAMDEAKTQVQDENNETTKFQVLENPDAVV